ncbi:MAG TPA: hypothetical protein VGP93_02975, partial [Polyangiaceae bacterium]|nr:hypothetical protein [Polyangiaceae bacterium]
MRDARLPAFGVVLVAVLVTACRGPAPAARAGEASTEHHSRRLVDERPPLELIERSGDPRPALAFAC